MTLHIVNGVKVRTNFDYPPIPYRGMDWSAVDDATYDGEGCPIGRGATEQEAIDDLLEQMECDRCAGTGITGHRARTGTYVGPGPVPDDSRGFVESTCSACRGTGASHD